MNESEHKLPLPDDLLSFARSLRSNQTDAECLLWLILRGRRFVGLKFRRQHPCPPYVLDFFCEELRLAVELDGGQHNTAEARFADARRSEFLAKKGIEMLRFWNHEILGDLEAVMESL